RHSRSQTPQVALPDFPRIQPRLSMFSREDCLRIHQASLSILRRTGVEVFCPEAVDLLQKAGAAVSGDLVKFPSSLVEWALASVPNRFNLYRRGSEDVALVLDGRSCYFGPGSDTFRYLDPRSGDRRNFKLADIADCACLCDALPEINFIMSMGVPRDVPEERYFWYQYATLLHNCTKPIVVVCDSLADMEAITAMAAAVAGGMDRLSQFPNILLYSEPTTPLQHSQTATEKLLFCAQHRIPITHSPAPMMGGTAPITLAGAVALGNAEILSSLVIHQLKNAGAPFLYGHGVHHLDMKTMISVYGAPEFQLARVMAAEMARFYSLPVWGYAGHTDSKVLDAQAAADAQFSVMTALLAETNLNHDVGYLEAGLATSPELILLTNELIGMTRRFVDGVRLDDEALALDVIHEVGPGGEFLSHDHTLAHWRDFWLPQNFDRQRLESWQDDGALDVNGRLRDQVVAIMDEHQVEPLPHTVHTEINRILNSE
ncbi:MAG: trimethylamine methyltransferase family protein, partial [Anaerolineales bacterium]|nr:trimethylamine methyltransferase family protein [Anaerolineales bacterium]